MVKKLGKYEANGIYTDFRSDVIAAGIVERGFDPDRLRILRRKGSSRQTDKEIDSIELRPDYGGDGEDVLEIRTNRPGMYDGLPEGIFHSSQELKRNSKEAIIDSMRRQSEQEFYIRSFFSIFESETDRSRIDIRLSELRYDLPDRHRDFVDTMLTFWPILGVMDTNTAILFTRTIPYIPEIRNSYSQIAQALAVIMGCGVDIQTEVRQDKRRIGYPRLSTMRIGVNSTLKGSRFSPVAVVKIKPDRDSLRSFLPEGSKRIITESLLNIFMPSDIDWEIRLTAKQEDCTSRLGDKKHPYILGVNARLKSKNS